MPFTMANRRSSSLNKGAWMPDEDAKLAKYIDLHGPRRWKSIAIKSGLNRCGKSCRLRWLNYLRPDIKRGNISEAEDDLILRLHRLLGNRWSVIARRLPGRTDNEIKNYWNAHLRKKAKLMEKLPATSITAMYNNWNDEEEKEEEEEERSAAECGNQNETKESGEEGEGMSRSDGDELFDFTRPGTSGLDWVKSFLELEEEEGDDAL